MTSDSLDPMTFDSLDPLTSDSLDPLTHSLSSFTDGADALREQS